MPGNLLDKFPERVARPGNLAAQSLQLVTLVAPGRRTGVQGESSHVSDRRGGISIAFIRQRLQGFGHAQRL